jgi:hypothetical protein
LFVRPLQSRTREKLIIVENWFEELKKSQK